MYTLHAYVYIRKTPDETPTVSLHNTHTHTITTTITSMNADEDDGRCAIMYACTSTSLRREIGADLVMSLVAYTYTASLYQMAAGMFEAPVIQDMYVCVCVYIYIYIHISRYSHTHTYTII